MTEKTTTALSTTQNNTPTFLADATSSLEKMQAYATLLINSGLVPKHFYELDQYRNPIKPFKGNTAAVIMTIQHGLELGMSITQSLQQIVPVNGLMSLKGDAAKALIMRSGLCKEWVEEEVGTAGTDTFGVKITSKRTDGQTISRSFTVQDAKRAGLWIDDAAVAKDAKFAKSPWFRYQPRMLRYRALGFISRDLYGDVLQNMYTEDEARDIDVDNTTFQTADGITARLDESKPEKLNSDAKEALSAGPLTAAAPKRTATAASKKAAAKDEPKQPELIQDAEIITDEPKSEAPAMERTVVYTKAQLDEKSAADLLKMVNEMLNINADEKLFAGDNKPKRLTGWLKKIILVNQEGKLDEMLQEHFKLKLSDLYPTDDAVETVAQEAQPELGLDVTENTAPTFVISEAGENGRTFTDLMDLDKKKSELGLSNDDILGFIKEQELEYTSVEQFYRHAPAETIVIAFGL